MKLLPSLASFAAVATILVAPPAAAQQRTQYESLVAAHASANNVPEALVHRVIVRESKYHPNLVGRGGTIGLMQIKLATARGVGYIGDAEGLRDPATNLAYGIKYLAGAYRAANGDHARAIRYYAGGYYYAAKRQRLERLYSPGPVLASAPPRDAEPAAGAPQAVQTPVEAAMEPKQAQKPLDLLNQLKLVAARTVPLPRKRPKMLANAKTEVPHPPAALDGANVANPR